MPDVEEDQKGPGACSPGHADKLFDLLKRVTPQKIDRNFIADNEITTYPNAGKVVTLARWLGLIDANGAAIHVKISKLKLVGDERNKYIAGMVKEAYKDLFERIDLQSATKNDIINYFIHNYSFGSVKAEFAGALFIHLCQTYGVPVGENLMKRQPSSNLERKPLVTRPTRAPKSLKNDDGAGEESKAKPQREGVGVEITISSFGLESAPHTTIIARSSEELDEKTENELSAFLKYVKILLDQKKVEQNNTASGKS